MILDEIRKKKFDVIDSMDECFDHHEVVKLSDIESLLAEIRCENCRHRTGKGFCMEWWSFPKAEFCGKFEKEKK